MIDISYHYTSLKPSYFGGSHNIINHSVPNNFDGSILTVLGDFQT